MKAEPREVARSDRTFSETAPTAPNVRLPALITATVIVMLATASLPFGRLMLPANTGFMPAFGTVVVLTDGLSGALLLVQSRLRGSHQLLHLSAAYLFCAMITVPHLLSFAGVFAPTALIGAADTPAWLWCFWHGGFGLGLLRFMFLPDRPPYPAEQLRTLLGVVVIVLLLTLVATIGLPYLPTLLQDGNYHRMVSLGIGPAILAVCLAAAVAVFLRLRCRDALSAWLFVSAIAGTLDVLLTIFGGGRYTVGWYGARVLSVITGVTVLLALLSDLMHEAGRVSNVNAQLEHLLHTDVLTEVANRRAFVAALDAEWRRATREQTTLALLLIDIDFFKGYNDRYGHPAGDECLRRVAEAFRIGCKRPGDIVARMGGEEFVVLLPTTEEAGAWQVAQRMREAVIDLAIAHERSELGTVTISVGVATVYPAGSAAGADALVDRADRALYQAKAFGRNTVCGAAPAEPLHDQRHPTSTSMA